MRKLLWHEIIQNFDALVGGVLLLPRGGLHLGVAGAHHDLDVGAAEAASAAAAVHRRIAAAEDDDPPTDLVGVAEEDAGQPFDPDPDIVRRLLPAGNVEVATVRRAAADEDRVVADAEQRFQAVDPATGDERATGRKRIADLLVDYLVGQAELGDLAAHHAAGA